MGEAYIIVCYALRCSLSVRHSPPLEGAGEVVRAGKGLLKKKGGTSLCLLNTSQWTRLPIKEYFIKLFDKMASRDALCKSAQPIFFIIHLK